MITALIIEALVAVALIVTIIVINNLRLDKLELEFNAEKLVRQTAEEQLQKMIAENTELRKEIRNLKQVESHPRKRTFLDIEGD